MSIIEEEPKTFCLVLPRLLSTAEEVDDADLTRAVGGAGTNPEMLRFFQGYA